MTEPQTISISPRTERPRHTQQEIADLLAAAVLRLRVLVSREAQNSERVDLGFDGQQRLNANPDQHHGVRP